MRTYTEQEAMRALTSTGGFLRGFAYSLNPYIGCAFGAGRGCPFCYVRALPVAHAHAGRWGTWVIAKTNLPQLWSGNSRRSCGDEKTIAMNFLEAFGYCDHPLRSVHRASLAPGGPQDQFFDLPDGLFSANATPRCVTVLQFLWTTPFHLGSNAGFGP